MGWPNHQNAWVVQRRLLKDTKLWGWEILGSFIVQTTLFKVDFGRTSSNGDLTIQTTLIHPIRGWGGLRATHPWGPPYLVPAWPPLGWLRGGHAPSPTKSGVAFEPPISLWGWRVATLPFERQPSLYLNNFMDHFFWILISNIRRCLAYKSNFERQNLKNLLVSFE